MREDAGQLLFIGNARGDAAGGRRLLDAVSLAREAGSSVELTLVCRVGEEPDCELPAGVRVVRAEGTQVHALLPNVMATIIPRPKNRYNDLALPVKLFDYLSFSEPDGARPLLPGAPRAEQGLRFEDVGFRYPAAPPTNGETPEGALVVPIDVHWHIQFPA